MTNARDRPLPAPGDVQSWDTLAPYFTALQEAPLTADTVPAWLERWSDLQLLVWEVRAGLKRARRYDLTDEAAAAAMQRFTNAIWEPSQAANQALTDRAL